MQVELQVESHIQNEIGGFRNLPNDWKQGRNDDQLRSLLV